MRETYDRSGGRELFGLLIIVLGFGMLMNSLGILPYGPWIERFWLPTVIVGIGVWQMSRSRGCSTAGLFFILFGTLFFLSRLSYWNFSMGRLIGPAVLIWLGASMLMNRSRSGRSRDYISGSGTAVSSSTDSSDFIQATAILGGFNRKCSSQQFRGGDITAIMGGGKIDLREARMQADQAVLDVFTLMGGVEIQVPSDWSVDQRFTPVLGGFEDRTNQAPGNTKRLAIHGTAVMGGVKIMN